MKTRKRIYDIIRTIARINNCSVIKHENTFSLYSKTGGWVGSLDKTGKNPQGIARNYELLIYDLSRD